MDMGNSEGIDCGSQWGQVRGEPLGKLAQQTTIKDIQIK